LAQECWQLPGDGCVVVELEAVWHDGTTRGPRRVLKLIVPATRAGVSLLKGREEVGAVKSRLPRRTAARPARAFPRGFPVSEELVQQLLGAAANEFADGPAKGVVSERFAGDLFRDPIHCDADATHEALSDSLIDDPFECGASSHDRIVPCASWS
jgi:hypothetical protein